MAAEQPVDDAAGAEDFDTAQQQLMVEIGQALIAQSTSGAVALELIVGHVAVDGVDPEIRLSLERQSGLTVPASADETLVDPIRRLDLLWRQHEREPWRTFTYRLRRGPDGPRFTSEFSF